MCNCALGAMKLFPSMSGFHIDESEAEIRIDASACLSYPYTVTQNHKLTQIINGLGNHLKAMTAI